MVYVLTVNWQRDSGECGSAVAVYSTIERANKAFLQEIKDARKDFSDLETEESGLIQGDMSWSIWEKDEYCYNHCDISIWEREVE